LGRKTFRDPIFDRDPYSRLFIHQVSRIPQKEQKAFEKGEDGALIHFRTFFEANPEADGIYREWIEGEK
jgi:hypothetical protein